VTIEELKKLAENVAYWLDRSGGSYDHKIVEEQGGVALYTIDKDEEDLDADDPYISWGCWGSTGLLFKDEGLSEGLVNVNGVIMGLQERWIAAMVLGSGML